MNAWQCKPKRASTRGTYSANEASNETGVSTRIIGGMRASRLKSSPQSPGNSVQTQRLLHSEAKSGCSSLHLLHVQHAYFTIFIINSPLSLSSYMTVLCCVWIPWCCRSFEKQSKSVTKRRMRTIAKHKSVTAHIISRYKPCTSCYFILYFLNFVALQWWKRSGSRFYKTRQTNICAWMANIATTACRSLRWHQPQRHVTRSW